MKRLLLAILIGGLLVLSAQTSWARKWSDASGKFSLEAELVEVKAGKVVLRKVDGSEITLSVARLSQADRRYLASRGKPAPSPTEPTADRQISALLKRVQQQSDVPAIAGAIVTSKGLVAFGVTGVRKRGTSAPATPNDLWHLGSNTKAITATLIARLIEQNRLKWDTTLADVFKGSGFEIHPDFQAATVLQLLSHRSGLPANLNLVDYLGVNAGRERLRAVQQELAKPPQSAPGSNFEYSNLGYIIAGAVVEKVTGKPWEKNVVEHVSGPLQMKSVGFGGTGTPGKVDQPWPHTADGEPVPQNGPTIDNPPVMGPAGYVHCTIQDWSKYTADFLRGMAGKPALLPSAAYKKLSTPPLGGEYALGWIVTEREWAGGTALTHSGSNTMNYATVWIAPQRDFAILACTNQGGDAAHAACDAAVVALLDQHTTTAGKAVARSSGDKPVTKDGYAKVAPFTGVRWKDDRPVVRVEDRWSPLVSIDGIPIDRIMEFAQKEFGDVARKRFAEDLVEVLATMGHEPEWEVTLGLETADGQVEDVEITMTEENRDLVRN
jgi:CubicO group peptidase (beta-lactamase class C family)